MSIPLPRRGIYHGYEEPCPNVYNLAAASYIILMEKAWGSTKEAHMPPDDPFNLARFVTAQASVYQEALAELRAGQKHSHWMWFIFPQLRELGRSPTAKFYGIVSLDEARAYLDHPLLGSRLEECTNAVLAISGPSLYGIFGSPDDMKFRSSMTLFSRAAPDAEGPYQRALDYWCKGVPDDNTLALIGPGPAR
jgi:uncharacterized protein (DUF1810 family)